MSIDINVQDGNLSVSGDLVGRDKIVNNIQNIVQRALTAAEEADQELGLEAKYLAQGVGALVQRLQSVIGEPPTSETATPTRVCKNIA